MQRHGRVTWREIKRKLRHGATCPKLHSYWQFYDCGYSKLRRTCAEPDHIGRCPLPSHDLRNGRLNQTAYALYLFIRDLADKDLIGWIDERLQAADRPADADRLARLRAAVIDPLRQVHGVSDKVLTMALSGLLLGDPKNRRRWVETGASMVTVDTLVHNFLHRTGILHRFRAGHAYGAACYRPGGCADIIAAVRTASMPAPSIRRSRRCFPGSCSTPSGGTAPSKGSTSATAIASTIASLATTSTVKSTIYVTEYHCINSTKLMINKV